MQGITLCRAGGESTHVFALTCRHVCYGEGETGSRLLGEETLPSKSVIQLPEKTQEKLVAGLETFQQKAAQAIQAEKMKGEACDKVKSRIFGNVAYNRGYGVRDPGFFSDWCLVQLQAGRHERRFSDLSNRFYIYGDDLESRFRAREPAIDIQGFHLDRTIQIRGIVAVSELLDPRVLHEASIVFTDKGNSGACVFDLEGRAADVATTGIKREELLRGDDKYGLDRAVDVTYRMASGRYEGLRAVDGDVVRIDKT
ncbi:hypothetical protein CI238_09064, partial [Colletotrichum incanum]